MVVERCIALLPVVERGRRACVALRRELVAHPADVGAEAERFLDDDQAAARLAFFRQREIRVEGVAVFGRKLFHKGA
jgi:hypothetical protein